MEEGGAPCMLACSRGIACGASCSPAPRSRRPGGLPRAPPRTHSTPTGHSWQRNKMGADGGGVANGRMERGGSEGNLMLRIAMLGQ